MLHTEIAISKAMLDDCCIEIETWIRQSVEKDFTKWLIEDNNRREQELLYGTGENAPKGFLNLSS